MKTKKTLGRKIHFAMIALVIGMLSVAGVIFMIAMRRVSNMLASSSRTLSETIGTGSSAYMTAQSRSALTELAVEKAAIADRIFSDFERGVRIVASVAGDIYDHPERYAPRDVPLPDPKNDGTLSVQVLYSSRVDPADPAVAGELGLIGNVQDVLLAVNDGQDNMASVYVATESGFMVQADYISARKFDASGELLPLEAKERPWYVGAAETGKPFFTPVTRDVHTPKLAIMCGVPVYSGGRLMAVAGAGMYLDGMEDLIRSVDVGESGKACILNGDGRVLFSTFEKGPLAVSEDAGDLRRSQVTQLAGLASGAAGGGRGVITMNVDGVTGYVAYAPMNTVGWSMVVFLPAETVDAPTSRLLSSIGRMTETARQDTEARIRRANWMLVGLLATAVAVALAAAAALSRRIVKPIRRLTDEVALLRGDDLDFRLDLNTGDETQELADSFRSMTARMKKYVSDIETITAERERISTELSLANRIQAAMLPSIFPPFPDRREFDLYAMMDPAREVGGDFYDFFLIDDDHLCLVMADVSGKGVPAALFMTISKIILKNSAVLGKSPAEALKRTNDAICANNEEEMFVTVWAGVLELSTGRLTAANAGHEYPAVRTPDGRFRLLKDRHGIVIGAVPGRTYAEYELTLEPGAKLFLYTDGIPEAMGGEGGAEMYGTERMLTALNRDPAAPPERILRSVRADLEGFVKDAEQFDDLTMLCLEYKGRTAEQS